MLTNVNLLSPHPVYKAYFSDKIYQLWCKLIPWGQMFFLLRKQKIYINFPKICFWSFRYFINQCKPQHKYTIIISCIWREKISWLSGKLCRWLQEDLRSEQLYSETDFTEKPGPSFCSWPSPAFAKENLLWSLGPSSEGLGAARTELRSPGAGTRGAEGEQMPTVTHVLKHFYLITQLFTNHFHTLCEKTAGWIFPPTEK